MITWDEKYELGIEVIDNQHKELIALTSKLSDLLTNAVQGEDIYDDMMTIIADLRDYTVYHFGYEEKIFDSIGYVNADVHKIEHKKLIDEIENLDLSKLDEDQVTAGKSILKFLITWVFKHISGSDFLYKEDFIAAGIK